MFNQTLMNKLIRIEWVIECHSSPYYAHGCYSSMNKWANIRDFHLSFFQMVAEWQDFTVVTKLIKNFKSLYGFGGRCFNIRDVCMDFEPCFKVYNLVSICPKSMKLGQITNLNVVFHMVGSVYRLITIRNSLQFHVEFWNGLQACAPSTYDLYKILATNE